MINDEILEAYINGFYGYGNFEAPFWFVGMEEGCADVIGEIGTRVNTWKNRGAKELDDLFHYHVAIRRSEYFGEKAKLQSTWKKLVRIVLNIRDESDENERVKKYQSERLGRENDETCILELMPLPSKKINDWLYPEISTIHYLQNRRQYENQIAPMRIESLKQKVAANRPKLVLFYGKPYEKYWNMIADSELDAAVFIDTKQIKKNGTLFVSINHPLLLTNEFLRALGTFIKAGID